MTIRKWLATRLRYAADRIDHTGAPKAISWSFTFELGRGIVFREDGRGCQLWYLGDEDYDRAHDEADNPPPRIDWTTMTIATPTASRTTRS